MKRTLIIISAIALAVFFTACPSSTMNLDVTPSLYIHYYDYPNADVQLIDADAFFDMEFTWRVGPNFTPPDQNLRAFVHFRDQQGNFLMTSDGQTAQRDHDIVPEPKNWKAGVDVVYTVTNVKLDRSLGASNSLVNVYVGLYNPKTRQRAVLTGIEDPQPADQAYLVATFRLKNNPYIYPKFNDTWYGPEPAPNEEHRWSKKESYVTFTRDPSAPAAELWFTGHSPAEDLPSRNQLMNIYIHEKTPEMLLTKNPFVFTRENVPWTRVPIPKELYQIYTDRDIKIIFEVQPAMGTETADDRMELGFRMQGLGLYPKNSVR